MEGNEVYMKKFVAILLCIQLLNIPVFAEELGEDYFVEKTLKSNNLVIETEKPAQIHDELPIPKNNVQNLQSAIKKDVPITDNLVEKKLVDKQYKNTPNGKTEIKDVFAEKAIQNKTAVGIVKNSNLEYDIDPTRRIPVKLKVNQEFTTKKNLEEGQKIEFKVAEDVKVGNKVFIPKNSMVVGRVETISLNEAFGVPSDIVIENFIVKMPDNEEFFLENASLKRVGANRTIWLYPLVYCGCICFGAGLLFIPIRGGHAKLKIKDTYEVYYSPSI